MKKRDQESNSREVDGWVNVPLARIVSSVRITGVHQTTSLLEPAGNAKLTDADYGGTKKSESELTEQLPNRDDPSLYKILPPRATQQIKPNVLPP